MKRLICWLLAMLMALSLCACGDEGGSNDETMPTEQASPEMELPQEVWERPWISSPATGEKKVEISPDGTCNLYGWHLNYTIVHISDDEVVLDADGTEIYITLNPLGLSELHVSGDWDDHYVNRPEYWDIIYKSWADSNGEHIEIFPTGVSMSTAGFYPEFSYDAENGLIDVLEDGQVLFTISTGDSQLFVMDMDGNEVLYNADVDYMDPGIIDDPEESMDEELQLSLAYDKAVNEFVEAINGRAVYDQDGNEISDGPALAEYLYDQFLALGDYLDAADYLSFFKTREETVTTVQESSRNVYGDVRVTVYDGDLPNYDVFGESYTVQTLLRLGIFYSQSGRQQRTKVYNENNMLAQVIITSKNMNGDVVNDCVADLEYNALGQHIATHVAFVDENGTDVRYTSTLEYDDGGNLIRIDIPYYTRNEDTGTYTALYAYDEQGRLLRDTFVALPDDLDWYEHYSKRPFNRSTSKNVYDENGLLIEEYTCSHAPDTAAYTITTYSYDENGVLVNRTLYSYDYDFVGFIDSGDYTREEVSDLRNKFICDIFGLPESYEDRAPESWVNNEDFDLSQWDWIPHTLEVNSEYTYTYDKTVTIMYIDLTPED